MRPHGVRGEVVVELITDRTERLAPGTVLFGRKGERFAVDASRRHQGRWLVQFGGVADRSGAEALRGTVLLAPPIEDADTYWIHDLIGAEVVERDGTTRGRVVSVEANPASDLLVLADGHLVPLRFVADRAPGRLVIEPPAGLFD